MRETLIDDAQSIYREHFPLVTWFERAVFFSWYCGTGDCAFCYMSTQEHAKTARRNADSILAEVLICGALGWKLGFVSGGHAAYTQIEFETLLRRICELSQEKVWINIGPLSRDELVRYRPYIKGVVASIETVNPILHDRICPSKPVAPFEQMFEHATELGLEKAMTIIIGLGETMEDFPLLDSFIRKHGISKIHIYSLNPQKGTIYENSRPPTKEYHAEWIARTRIAFPTLDIQAGIWLDRVESVGLLLNAGANSISKFPALRHFCGREAHIIEEQAYAAGRSFKGSLTHRPDPQEILGLSDDPLIQTKLKNYLKSMRSADGHTP
jgi:biotin synthase-like enzyme